MRNVRRATVLAVAVLVVSTLGYMVLEGWSFRNMIVILGGIGTMTYAASSVVGLVVEGTVGGYFRRRRMEA